MAIIDSQVHVYEANTVMSENSAHGLRRVIVIA